MARRKVKGETECYRVIVRVKDKDDALFGKTGVKWLPLIGGYAASLTAEEIKHLEDNDNVISITFDEIASIG